MARNGSVGQAEYKKVEALAKTGMTKMAAIKAVADELGKQPGTVQANYYRVAKQKGGGRRKPAATTKTRRPSAQAPARQRRTAASATDPSIDTITGELVASVEQLARTVKEQNAEVADLRRKLDGVRSLLG